VRGKGSTGPTKQTDIQNTVHSVGVYVVTIGDFGSSAAAA